MSVTPLGVLKAAGRITLETLEVLVDILTDPSRAHTYCDKVGVPPFTPSAEWTPAVAQLREKADAAKSAEQWAEVSALAIKILNGIHEKLAGDGLPGPGAVEAGLLKIVTPVLLYVIPKVHVPGNVLVYTILAAIYFTDQRLQASYPQGLFAERWGAIFGDLALAAGWGHRKPVEGEPPEEPEVEVDWAPITSDALALATVVVTLILEMDAFKRRLIRFWYGFDHPPIEAFPEARALAQHAFTLLLDAGEQRIAPEDFDAAIGEQPPEEPPAPLAITFVPVPQTMGGTSRLYVQVHGQADIREKLGRGFELRLTNGASFGLLASDDGLEATGNVSFQAELVRETPPAPRADPAEALEFRIARFGLGARASVDELSAWLRIEGGELGITGGHWLGDYLPQLRFSFDLMVEASVLDGVRFAGGAGGEVLLPIHQRIPFGIGSARIESVRVRAKLGDDGGQMAFRLEAAAHLTLELFSILTVHVNGIGAGYRTSLSGEGDGNLAGIAKMGWEPVIPEGAGLELDVWKIQGGGALFYDAVHDRLSGAIELQFADSFSLTGLGIYQRATASSVRSWLAVVSFELPRSGAGFSFQGAGLLYGSNRTTSPEAFLAGIATGDLDAVLFPEDPIGNAPQYLAALERLFPTQADSSVLGISAKFAALGGRLTLDLGVLFEFAGDSLRRLYVVAQFVGLLKAPKEGEEIDPLKQPVRVLADGVAIWDTQTDELNLRIALRNSRVWAGELTGGASLFHGAPQTDGQERGTYISIGGFHPDYVPPGTKIFVPPRLSLALSKGDHLKLTMRAYLAVTPCSFQFGLSGDLEARLYGFGIRGHLALDLLVAFDAGFVLRLEFSVELLLGSRSIAAVRFVGTVVGFVPSVLSGKVEVKFLFWTLSKHGSLTIYEGDAPQESVNVQASLAAAIGDPAHWESGGAAGLALFERARAGVWLSPDAPLRLRQPVVPLNVPIERFGSIKLAAPQTLGIEQVRGAAGPVETRPVSGEFALGMFLELSQEEMLASRGFESRDAGVEIARAVESGAPASASTDFEEILLDPKKRPETAPPFEVVLGELSVFAVLRAGRAEAAPLQMSRERFAVVDASLSAQLEGKTFFEARAALRAGWRVVPETEVVR